MPHVDVLILGGGIIGCALAEELARHGQRVMVIERGRIGEEASSAAAGILSAQSDLTAPDAFFELCQASRKMYPRWIAHLERRSGVSVGYHVEGLLYLAMTSQEEKAMERRAKWQRKRGLRVERWSRKEIQRHEPRVDGRIRCGFHFPTEAQVDNVLLMRSLALACRTSDVTLLERAAVRRLLMRGQAIRGVETDQGPIEAPIVVNCLGSWASMGGRFPVPLPIEPARGQMLAFRGPRGVFHRPIMSERAYVVQRRDGRLLVGSTVEFAGFEKALTLEGLHGILCGLRHLSSALDDCTFLEAWAGFRPCSTDRLPILGNTPIDGLHVATGHFRHGILLAPITARLMTELVLDDRPALDLRPFSPARFSQ